MKAWLTRDEDPQFGDWCLWLDVRPVEKDGVWRRSDDGGYSSGQPMEEGFAEEAAKDSGIILQPGECKQVRHKLEVIK